MEVLGLLMFCLWWYSRNWLQGFLDHTHTHTHSRYESSEAVISSSKGRYLHKTQQTQETNTHAIRNQTRDPGNQTAADLRLRPHGHRHQPQLLTDLHKTQDPVEYCSTVATATLLE